MNEISSVVFLTFKYLIYYNNYHPFGWFQAPYIVRSYRYQNETTEHKVLNGIQSVHSSKGYNSY